MPFVTPLIFAFTFILAGRRVLAAPAQLPRSELYSIPPITILSSSDCIRLLTPIATSEESYVNHSALCGGLGNSNYKLVTNRRKILLKVCEDKSESQLLSQIRALNLLRLHGVPCSFPIPCAAAAAFAERPDVQRVDPSCFSYHFNFTFKIYG